MTRRVRKGIVSFVIIGAACGTTVYRDVTIAPGHVVTSKGRVVHMDSDGCYRLRASETDLGMAVRYCPTESAR